MKRNETKQAGSKGTVLITGATSGIGRHAALHLAARGFRVFATGRNERALADLAHEAEGLALETLVLDVTSPASIEHAHAEVDRRTDGRGLDALVNNAGYGCLGPMEMVADDDLRKQFDTNVFGLMAVTRAFLPAMRRRGAGRILNVSSVGGRITLPFFGAYNATKYAVESMSDAMRLELRPFGVEVILIEPGMIRTEFSDRSYALVSRYDGKDSPWAPVLSRASEMKAQADAISASPAVIARAMERALTARRPRARYVAPFSTAVALWFGKLLPTSWVDAMMRAATGLTRRRLSPDRALDAVPAA